MEDWRDGAKRMVQGILAQQPDLSTRVADALMSVPRHEFVGDAASGDINRAYEDLPLPIPGSKGHVASVSQPSVVASMLEALGVREGQKVLEIGAGSGYVAALLSELTGDDGRVTTLDIDPILVEKARKNLGQAGKSAVRVLEADAFVCPSGLADEEFDRVLFSASVQLPPRWIVRSLSDGGVMVFPLDLLVTRPGWPCFLARLKKEGEALRGHFPTETVQGWLPLEQGGTSLAANPRPEWDTNETYYLLESFQQGLTGMCSPTGLLIHLLGGIEAALESGQVQSLEDCRPWLECSGWREIHQRWLDDGSPTNASFALSLSDSLPELPPDRELVWRRKSDGQTMCLLGVKT